MKILIVGGGVAGPTLAKFLKGFAEITLVDKAPAWGNVGYAISLWGNGQRILKELGIDNSVLKTSYEIPWNSIEDHKGRILKTSTFDVFRAYGPTAVITRTIIQQALVKNLETFAKIKFSTTVTNISQDESGASVTLSDGSVEKFDLVVGADGIHSIVRELVFGKEFLKYYGWGIYAFWTPPQVTPPRGSIEFSEGGKICFIYPMEDRAVVMLAVAGPVTVLDKNVDSKKILHGIFSDFTNSVAHLIDQIEDPSHVFHDNLARVDMQEWYRGRVVLIGDAEHAVSPITGMGTSMALEDAFVLAQELKSAGEKNIGVALEKFAQRRGKRIRNFIKSSRVIENWLMVKSPTLGRLRDIVIRFVPVWYFTRIMKKILKEKI